MLQVDRQLREIGLVAAQHHLLRRRLALRHGAGAFRVCQPPEHRLQQVVRVGVEGQRKPFATAGNVADEAGAFLPDIAEQDCVAAPVELCRHIREVGAPRNFDKVIARSQPIQKGSEIDNSRLTSDVGNGGLGHSEPPQALDYSLLSNLVVG